MDSFSHLMNLLKQYKFLNDFLFVAIFLYYFLFNKLIDDNFWRTWNFDLFDYFFVDWNVSLNINRNLMFYLYNDLPRWNFNCLILSFIAHELILLPLQLNNINNFPDSVLDYCSLSRTLVAVSMNGREGNFFFIWYLNGFIDWNLFVEIDCLIVFIYTWLCVIEILNLCIFDDVKNRNYLFNRYVDFLDKRLSDDNLFYALNRVLLLKRNYFLFFYLVDSFLISVHWNTFLDNQMNRIRCKYSFLNRHRLVLHGNFIISERHTNFFRTNPVNWNFYRLLNYHFSDILDWNLDSNFLIDKVFDSYNLGDRLNSFFDYQPFSNFLL